LGWMFTASSLRMTQGTILKLLWTMIMQPMTLCAHFHQHCGTTEIMVPSFHNEGHLTLNLC